MGLALPPSCIWNRKKCFHVKSDLFPRATFGILLLVTKGINGLPLFKAIYTKKEKVDEKQS